MDNTEINQFLQTIIEPDNPIQIIDESTSIKELFEIKLKEIGLSQFQIEKFLNIEHKTLEGILDKTAKRVDVVNILKLSNFLNIENNTLLRIFSHNMPSETFGELERAKKSNYIVSNFDITNLRKCKFLKSKDTIQDIENRITKFFGLSSILDYSKKIVNPAYSRTKRSPNQLMRTFWIVSAKAQFEGINNPNDFDREALVRLMPKIRPYTINVEKGLLTVVQALYNIGITIIYQPMLPTVQVRGATLSVNDKPCIVLTDWRKNYPTIWFALMHELHHVLYDFEDIQANKYHLSGELDLFLDQEDNANNFSREYLFSEEKSKFIFPLINDELLVYEYAKKSQIHPSIIYNFHNYDLSMQGDSKAWTKFKIHFPDVKLAIQHLNTNLWNKDIILDSVKEIKETVFNLN